MIGADIERRGGRCVGRLDWIEEVINLEGIIDRTRPLNHGVHGEALT